MNWMKYKEVRRQPRCATCKRTGYFFEGMKAYCSVCVDRMKIELDEYSEAMKLELLDKQKMLIK